MLPLSPQRGLKNAKRPFRCKIALRLKNVYYKVSLCEKYQRQNCKAFVGLTTRAKMIGGGRPLLRKNVADTDPPPDFLSIFARSASAVTPSEKSSFNTKFITRFPMSLTRTSYVAPKSHKGDSKTQSVKNLNKKLR